RRPAGRPLVALARRSAARLQRALDLALRVAVDERAPLVPHVLAARERELDLDAPVLEVEARRHERQALLAHLAVEAVDLLAVQEQLPRPGRLVVRAVPLVVGRDLRVQEP